MNNKDIGGALKYNLSSQDVIKMSKINILLENLICWSVSNEEYRNAIIYCFVTLISVFNFSQLPLVDNLFINI